MKAGSIGRMLMAVMALGMAATAQAQGWRPGGNGGFVPPVVRDHRTPPVVRDHRTPPPPPVIRDHRSPYGGGYGGGVRVTPGPARDPRGGFGGYGGYGRRW